MRPLQGILPDGNILVVDSSEQNRHRPIDLSELADGFGHTVVEGGPVGPEVIEPLELLVLDHADPADQHAVMLFRILRNCWSIHLRGPIRP